MVDLLLTETPSFSGAVVWQTFSEPQQHDYQVQHVCVYGGKNSGTYGIKKLENDPIPTNIRM
jgi:hypothetical protein